MALHRKQPGRSKTKLAASVPYRYQVELRSAAHFRVGADVAHVGKLRHVARFGLLCVLVRAMNLGLAAGAKAFQRRAALASSLMRLDERRSRCDRKQRAAAADEVEQWYDCAFKGATYAAAAREFNSAEQPLTSSQIPA